MDKKILFIGGAVALGCIGVIFLVLGVTKQPSTPLIAPVAITGPTDTSQPIKAPDFSLQDYNGKTVQLADFSGKPMVINSWAAWCPFCRKELPDFADVQKEFGDRIIIIAIDRAESKEIAKKYSDELGVTDNLLFLLDPSDSFYQSIDGFSMPETIFVDKDGFIRDHKRGPMDSVELRAKIQKLF